MVTGKAAFFVEGNSERAVAGADLQYMVSAFVFSKKIFNKTNSRYLRRDRS